MFTPHSKPATYLFLMITIAAVAIAILFNLYSRDVSATPERLDSAHGQIAINELLFNPVTGDDEWVELINQGSEAVDIRSFVLSNENGLVYKIPASLPAVPPGAFVLITFDGAASNSNDLDFSDGVARLHAPAGVGGWFSDDEGQVALYDFRAALNNHTVLPLALNQYIGGNPPVPLPPSEFLAPSLVSFVAWGAAPGEAAGDAQQAGLWPQSWYVPLYRGLGEQPDQPQAIAGEPIGVVPGGTGALVHDWALYGATEATPGSANLTPAVSWSYPAPGATVAASTFMLSWHAIANATGYRIQLALDPGFSALVVDELVSEPSYKYPGAIGDGLYYWRVRAQSPASNSRWSAASPINAVTMPAPSAFRAAESTAFNVLGLPWRQQRKDTNMLCLDGDNEAGTHPWNAPHPTRGTHGRNYCVRASVSMIAAYYGGNLTQDRITYETLKGGAPEGDLGHDVPFTGTQARASLAWALGTNVPANVGKPTFAQIKQWIDAGRPLRAVIPGHSRVIDGYFEFDLLFIHYQMLHILDPWDGAKWVDYASDDIKYVQAGPAGTDGAPNVRSDEDIDSDGIPDTIDDSDNDGVVDFDERNRFATSFSSADWDGDDVQDGADIRGYLFNNDGAYSRRNPDIDDDGKRKEVDKDNDYASNDGTVDGCEDRDRDGKDEVGETNNFSPVDDKLLHVRLTWPQVGSDVDLHMLKPGAALWTDGDVHWLNKTPDWGPTGRCGNPTLDVDCITSCTVENIRLDTLEPGLYTVVVHYYSDHDQGPTQATVTMQVADKLFQFSRAVSDDQFWTVATISWPDLTVSGGGLSANGRTELSVPAK